jgi:mercuric reductase
MTSRQLAIEVAGMTCDACAAHVTAALQAAGAQAATTDFRRGVAMATVPAAVDTAALTAAIRQAGYEPGTIRQLDTPARPSRAGRGNDYDLAIIGSGSAAFAAAITATGLGARVVMVEHATVGGTCVNVGCVPSKALLRAAETYYQAGRHPFAGITTRATGVDLGALIGAKDELVGQLRREKYLDLVGDYGWELRHGRARFVDERSMAVNGQPLVADTYLLATGAMPFIPPIPGLAEAGYLTSTTAFSLEELPTSLAVIGGNAIGLEVGQIFARLGTKVTVLEVLDRIAPFEEPEVSEALHAALAEEGIGIVTGAQITGVAHDAGSDQRRLTYHAHGHEHQLAVAQVLVATGRRPNTAELNLTQAGIATDERGAVVVDAGLRTTNPRVWAAGDVTPSPQYVYVAAYQGKLAAENAITPGVAASDLSALPGVTFTSPQVASVGLTEARAREQDYDVKTSLLPLHAVPRALVNRDTRGLFKLVADAQTDRILGVHIVAENAGDVIYAGVLAVKFKLTVQDLVGSFAPYLTMAEGLKLAAQTFDKDVAKLSCCAA